MDKPYEDKEFMQKIFEGREYLPPIDDFKVEVPNPREPYPDRGICSYTIDMNEYPTSFFIHPTAQIGPRVEIGEGTYIGPFCVIGYPAEHKEYWDKPIGKVIIGKNCRITGHVTIDAGTTSPTYIGDNVWMLKHSHVGHDAIVGDDVTISCGAKVGGHCVISDHSNLGLNCCIHQRVVIPSHTMIGMGAVVTKTFPSSVAGRKYAGVPAKDIGPNIKK